MSRVTMELRKVLEIEEFSLFDFDYDISDLKWKEELERDFVDTFYFNEIGMETIDRWKHYVKRKFQHIMPYYNKLYMSTLLELDPLLTHKRTETYTGENTGSGSGTTSDNNKTFDYPQNANPSQDIASTMDDSSSTSSTSSTSAMNYEKVITGFDGDQNALLKSYRDNILRINEMIMKECKDLFILVY